MIISIPPPSPDVLSWIRNIPESHQQLNINIGMSIKVRFDNLWNGGIVNEVLRNRKIVKIDYDDGIKEDLSFPDNHVIVDDKDNGAHESFVPSSCVDSLTPPSTCMDNLKEDSSFPENDIIVDDKDNAFVLPSSVDSLIPPSTDNFLVASFMTPSTDEY